MKWAGITIIFLSCSGVGLWASLILEKRNKFWDEYREMIKKGKELGIAREEFSGKVDEYWEEGQK